MDDSARPCTEEIQRLCAGTQYRVREFLGRGGMGQVWVVRHEFLGRDFALKILHPRFGTHPKVIDRLRLEAQVTARIDHPGVAQVSDFWLHEQGQACLVMELLKGRTLGQELREKDRMPVLDVLGVGCQVLSTLDAAHRLGVIHRDIKPENIFLHDLPGRGRVVKVLDFGLARVIAEYAEQTPAPPLQHTRTGAAVGTPRFMSPEAACGGLVDPRSDVYSVGLVLYEAIAGRGPFDNGMPGGIAKPSAQVQGVDEGVDSAILRAIHFNPADRFASAKEFETELRRHLPAWFKSGRS